MGILFNKKKVKELVVVFDMGSSSIGGAVFESRKGGSPNLIYSFREPIIVRAKLEAEKFLPNSLTALNTVAENISKQGYGKISKFFCVLSSAWVASQTRKIKYEANTPFVLTEKIANGLIEKEISFFEADNMAQFHGTEKEFRMIEFRNMKTTLNGYNTASPLGKKAEKLEMTVFFSMASKHALEKFEEIVFSHFHNKEIRYSSFAFSSFAIARDMFVDKDDFLLVDIAGEMTDIALIKGGVLNNSISYPLGRNYVMRGVAEKLHSSLSQAKSLISLYKDGHALEALEKKIGPLINTLKDEWAKGFQDSLFKISEDISVPATIFITVDQELQNFFQEIILGAKFSQYTLAESEFHILFLDTKTLHHTISFNPNTKRDSFLILEVIYINRFFC